MIVIGLTGSIGMGKTTVAAQFARLGAKVCNADNLVHRLLAKGGEGVAPVGKAFPGVVKAGVVDRKALGHIVFHNKEKMKKLEKILHPLVVKKENEFVAKHKKKNVRVVVLDIPLLFETGGQKRCDVTVVVTASAAVQKKRVMQRAGMTAQKFKAVLAVQMPDKEKRKRADYVIDTGKGLAYSFKQVAAVMKALNAT